jgi:hypothetical protein
MAPEGQSRVFSTSLEEKYRLKGKARFSRLPLRKNVAWAAPTEKCRLKSKRAVKAAPWS